jgi:hypothetical protein
MENENEVIYPAAGPSIAYAIGFWAVYVAIVFTVLGIFFRIPF